MLHTLVCSIRSLLCPQVRSNWISFTPSAFLVSLYIQQLRFAEDTGISEMNCVVFYGPPCSNVNDDDADGGNDSDNRQCS